MSGVPIDWQVTSYFAPRAGQVWLDCDPRRPNRKLVVVEVDHEKHMVICDVLPFGGYRSGRVTIAKARFKPSSRGYALLSKSLWVQE